MKRCTKCQLNLPLDNFNKDKSRFDGLAPKCRLCFKEDNALRYQKKKESIKKHNRKWNQENKERNKETWRKYYEQNRELLIERSKKWNQENREQFNLNQRQSRDPIASSVRSRLNKALSKYLNENKKYSTEHYLGCDIENYKLYLEKQFTKKMGWNNYGTYWEIDHIIPLSKGGSFHYTNTQPLTVTENRQKSNKL